MHIPVVMMIMIRRRRLASPATEDKAFPALHESTINDNDNDAILILVVIIMMIMIILIIIRRTIKWCHGTAQKCRNRAVSPLGRSARARG